MGGDGHRVTCKRTCGEEYEMQMKCKHRSHKEGEGAKEAGIA